MSKIDLTKYGITGTTEIVYNPSFEELFEEALQTENTFLDGKLMVFCGETSKAESRK